MNPTGTQLQETLYREIPLTRALEVTVAEWDGTALTLRAPLAPNVNHTQTAFAGSLAAVTTLAGWGLLWLLLRERGAAATLVIQDSSIRYLRPVTTDLEAHCALPEAAEVARFLETLQAKGRARLELHVEIRQGDAVAVQFSGRYVALTR